MSSKNINVVDLVMHILTEADSSEPDMLEIAYFIADSLSEKSAKKLINYVKISLELDGIDS
jgi:hypothetical protein